MRSKNLRVAGVSILTAPFFLAGWFVAAWLSTSPLEDSTRVKIVVVDPPAELDRVAQNLGFGVIDISNIKTLRRAALSLHAPNGVSAETALQILKEEFPGVALNASQQSGN